MARKIVLVDDNEADIVLMSTLLGELDGDLEVHSSPDPAGAWGVLDATDRPQMVLLDLNLEVSSGLELLRRIRGSDDVGTLPVVIMSSSDRNSDIAAAYEAGANAYMVKSADLGVLRRDLGALVSFWFDAARVPRL